MSSSHLALHRGGTLGVARGKRSAVALEWAPRSAPEPGRCQAALTTSTTPSCEENESDISALRSVLLVPMNGSSTTVSSRVVGRANRDTETLVRAIAGHDIQSLPRVQTQHSDDAVLAAARSAAVDDNQSGQAAAWDLATLLQALDRIPDALCTAPSEFVPSLQREASAADLDDQDLDWTADRGPVHPHTHVPGVLRSLFASIAPASPLAAFPQSHLGDSLPYNMNGHAPSAPASQLCAASTTASRTLGSAAPRDGEGKAPASAPRRVLGPSQSATTLAADLQQQARRQQGQLPAESGPQPDLGFLLGPHIAGRGPAAAPLVCAAVGVPLPPWAESLLPPAAIPVATIGLRLDPSLEWALGVLSDKVVPLEPRPSELRLANRILAAHLGPAPPLMGPEATATRTAVRHVPAAAEPLGARSMSATLPWPLVLPVLDAVSGRLSPSSALALLRVISQSVGPHWRRELPKGHQAHLADTLQTCFRTALRSPGAVSPSTAAGLLAVMSRLNLRSPAVCSLLVARVVAGVAPQAGRCRRGAVSPVTAAGLKAAAPPIAVKAGAVPATPTSARAGLGLRVARRSGRQGVARPLELGPRRAAQLRWVCVALSTLSRLHIPPSVLPPRAVTKMLWAALFSSGYWTPGIAAALPVWAHRLACRPPDAFLRRYARALLTAPSGPSRRWAPATTQSPLPQPQPGGTTADGDAVRVGQSYTDVHGRSPSFGSSSSTSSSNAAGGRGGGGDPGIPRGVSGTATTADGTTPADMEFGSATTPRGRCLVERMTASQLFASLEALVVHCHGSWTAGLGPGSGFAPGSGPKGGVQGTVPTASGRADGEHGGKDGGGGGCDDPSTSAGGQEGLLRTTHCETLMRRLATALTRRVGGLRRDQLCRLPLLLSRVSEALPEALAGLWEQVYLLRARAVLPSADVVDVMLLLRGLAVRRERVHDGVRPAAAAAAEGGGGGGGGTAVGEQTDGCNTAPVPYGWLGMELADDALRRYAVLLPSVSLYHTAAVLESVALLWQQPPGPPKAQLQGGLEAQDLEVPGVQPAGREPRPRPTATQASSPAPNPTTAATAAAVGTRRAAARVVRDHKQGAPELSPSLLSRPLSPAAFQDASPALEATRPSTEEDLRRRRLADLASERDFLLQQLDDHVATCLLYGGGGGGGGGGQAAVAHRRRDRSGGGRSGRRMRRGRIPPGLVVKVLVAYGLLERRPPPALQGAMEEVLVAGGEGLGTQGWQRVREAYRRLGLQPGRDLSVALLTFG